MAEKYEIELGVRLDTGDIRKQINSAEAQAPKINLEFNTKKVNSQLDSIRKQIKNLGNIKVDLGGTSSNNAISISAADVSKITQSFNILEQSIVGIRKVIGTLDDGSEMKSLLASINEINSSLKETKIQFESLSKSFKGMNLNLDFKFGSGKNPIAVNAEYGKKVRNETLPQLKEQYRQIAEYVKKIKGLKSDWESTAVSLALRGGGAGAYDLLGNMGGGASLSKQMDAYKQTITYMKKAASLDNIDLSPVTAGFKSPDELINEAERVQSGIEQAEKSAEEAKQQFKSLFGSGVDSEALNAQLNSIVSNLTEIKSALQSLSANNAIDGLTQSFNGLSQTLEKLIKNVGTFKQAVNSGLASTSNINTGIVNEVKTTSGSLESAGKQIGKKIGDSVEDGFKSNFNLDDEITKEVRNLMKAEGISTRSKTGKQAEEEISTAFREYLIDGSEAGIRKVTDALLNNKKVVDETKKVYQELDAAVRSINDGSVKVLLDKDIVAEYGDDFKEMQKLFGKGFVTRTGKNDVAMSFDEWFSGLPDTVTNALNDDYNRINAFGELFNQLQQQRSKAYMSTQEMVSRGEFSFDEAGNSIRNASERINALKQASMQAANSTVQSEEKKQQAYKKTLEDLRRINDEIDNSEHTKKLNEINEQFESLYDEDSGFTKDEADAAKQPLIDNYWSGQEEELARYNVLLEERARLESKLKEINSVNVSSGEGGYREMSADVDTLKGNLTDLQEKLKSVGFNDASVKSLTDEFKELGITVSSVHSKLDDSGNLTLTVKGIGDAKEAVTVVGKLKDGSDNIELDITVDDSKLNASIKKIKEKISRSGDDILDSDYDRQISNIENSFGKLTNQTDDLKGRIENLKTTLAQMYQTNDAKELIALNEQLEQSLKNVGNAVANAAKSQEEAAAKEAKARAEKAKGIEFKVADGGKYSEEVRKLETRFDNLSTKTNESTIAINKLKQSLKDMQNASSVDERIEAEKRYQVALQQTKSSLDRLEQAQKTSIDSAKLRQDATNLSLDMGNWLRDNSAAAKQFGAQIRSLQSELKSCDSVRFDGIKGEFKQLKAEAKSLGLTTQTFSDRIKTQFQKYSAYFGVAELFMYAEQGLRDMFEQVKLIDSAMTELRKVTDETDASYNKFLNNAAERAKVIGTTIDGLVDSTAEFAKIGYSFTDSQGLAEVANIYKVVGDNIDSAETATQSLISTMAAFKDEMNGMSNEDFAMSIVDKFNEVSNKYSIGSGGLGEALTRSASSMAAANNTLDETIALITAANEVVQNPEKIGNGLKTISMRIRGAKTELEEAGESTEGMASSTASLRAEIMALSGVDILIDSNTFKSTYQIMEELSQKWEGLSDIAQAKCLPEYTEMYIREYI